MNYVESFARRCRWEGSSCPESVVANNFYRWKWSCEGLCPQVCRGNGSTKSFRCTDVSFDLGTSLPPYLPTYRGTSYRKVVPGGGGGIECHPRTIVSCFGKVALELVILPHMIRYLCFKNLLFSIPCCVIRCRTCGALRWNVPSLGCA